MIIIWRGWGIIVPGLLFLALIAAGAINSALSVPTKFYQGGVALLCGLAAAVAIWLIARRLEARPGRVLIDKATGREFKVGASAGSFFFIPTRYWAFISAGLALLMALSVSGTFKP
jgi:hypothetical protein